MNHHPNRGGDFLCRIFFGNIGIGNKLKGIPATMTKNNDSASRALDLKIITREQAKAQGLDPSRSILGIIDGDLTVEAIVEVDFLPSNPKSGVFYHLSDGTMWIWSNNQWQETNVDAEQIARDIEAGVQRAKDYVDSRGFITKTVEDLVNYYLKSDVYNKDEIDDIIASTVQSDWVERDPESPSYIKNKPLHLVEDENYVHTDNNFTDAFMTKLTEIKPAEIVGEVLSI